MADGHAEEENEPSPAVTDAASPAPDYDDHSRFLTGHQFVRRPDAVRFAAVLRAAVASYGVPAVLYADNGGCFTDASLARTCAVLGIKLVHSQPGRRTYAVTPSGVSTSSSSAARVTYSGSSSNWSRRWSPSA
ncbi:MAG: integrase catalytic domain-containing protein [Streptosporangiaceae bacterium]